MIALYTWRDVVVFGEYYLRETLVFLLNSRSSFLNKRFKLSSYFFGKAVGEKERARQERAGHETSDPHGAPGAWTIEIFLSGMSCHVSKSCSLCKLRGKLDFAVLHFLRSFFTFKHGILYVFIKISGKLKCPVSIDGTLARSSRLALLPLTRFCRIN